MTDNREKLTLWIVSTLMAIPVVCGGIAGGIYGYVRYGHLLEDAGQPAASAPPAPTSTGVEPLRYGQGPQFHEPTYGYSLDAPAGARFTPDGPRYVELTTRVDGVPTHVSASVQERDGLSCERMAPAMLDYVVERLVSGENVQRRIRTIGGQGHQAAIFDQASSRHRAEVVVYCGPTYVVAVISAAPVDRFDSTAAFRDELFQRRVGVPRLGRRRDVGAAVHAAAVRVEVRSTALSAETLAMSRRHAGRNRGQA